MKRAGVDHTRIVSGNSLGAPLFRQSINWIFRGRFGTVVSSRFPVAETGVGGDAVRMLGQCDGKPSIAVTLAGMSISRTSRGGDRRLAMDRRGPTLVPEVK